MDNRLGIIVPYRHRHEQLIIFNQEIKKYLDKTGIDYRIIIVQQDDAKLFNRGMLLNIGFRYAKKMKCNYVVFHDIDMLPIDVDYSYSDVPLHLADPVFDKYFGGVTLFPTKVFEKINGYSNKYWGWGFEDDDLLLRCIKKNIQTDNVRITNKGNSTHAFKFNGIDSYIKINNCFDFDNNYTIFVSFWPEDIICDYTKQVDYYTLFSIPGYDTSISFNSFSRYNFCTFDEDKNTLYVNSNIKPNYKTNIAVTIDNTNKRIKVFQDGILIGDTEFSKPLLSYLDKRFFYLGVGEPNRSGDERFFKGYITKFAAFKSILSESDIELLSNNEIIDESNAIIYLDAERVVDYKLKNLGNTKVNSKLINCEIVNVNIPKYTNIQIPLRRESKFRVLPHEDNGFFENNWKHQETRWNQLRFINEVSINSELLDNDGLSTLQFIEHNKVRNNNILYTNVGI
jgi:hypothetical protein